MRGLRAKDKEGCKMKIYQMYYSKREFRIEIKPISKAFRFGPTVVKDNVLYRFNDCYSFGSYDVLLAEAIRLRNEWIVEAEKIVEQLRAIVFKGGK
jgi:hypothetical protein